jgi:hypothetical protein
VDHSGRELAAGRHAPRARGIGEFTSEGQRNGGNFLPSPPEFIAQGDRVLVIGVATGKIKATNKAFKDEWVFDITVLDGKLTRIREYIDTQALARASVMAASPGLEPI